MFRSIKQWCIGALSTVFVMSAFSAYAADGGALFKQKCATCHDPFKDNTGPALQGVRQRWSDGGAKEGSIYKWVANYADAAATDKYAAEIAASRPSAMSTFPELAGKQEDIDAIFDWVDAQVPPTDDKGGEEVVAGEEEEEGGLSMVWIILGVIFVAVIMSVGGVRRQLNNATRSAEGKSVSNDRSYGEEFKSWAWKYKRYVGLGGLVITISLIVCLFLSLYSIGVMEEYQPSQPIAFPHDIHTGKNEIDCRYCHNSAIKSKTAGLPTVNVCMNCHKQIAGAEAQVPEIAKIYAAAGWDPAKKVYTGKTKEIVWNKVHVLPDHVYFNHSQHVVVGGVDCKQCHGDMTKQKETARVVPVKDLNKIEGNIPLTKATLTMGWCIECHAEKEITNGSLDSKGNAYYTEMHNRLLKNKKLYNEILKEENGKVKITVKELGGWECAKCHY
jgi:cytochrome c551/c552